MNEWSSDARSRLIDAIYGDAVAGIVVDFDCLQEAVLNTGYEQVAWLRFEGQLSYRAIGEAIGKSRSAPVHQLQKLLQILRHPKTRQTFQLQPVIHWSRPRWGAQ